jgi:hypothetical protein
MKLRLTSIKATINNPNLKKHAFFIFLRATGLKKNEYQIPGFYQNASVCTMEILVSAEISDPEG